MATTSIRCTIGWHHWQFANTEHTGVRSCTNCAERRYHGSHRATDVPIGDAPYGSSLAAPSPDGMGGFSRITAWFGRDDADGGDVDGGDCDGDGGDGGDWGGDGW